MAKDGKRQISKGKKIYDTVSTVLVIAVFVFLAVMLGVVLYQRAHGGEANFFGYYLYDVMSDSMEPTIKVGEVIISKKVEDAGALKVGDVITFTAPSGQLEGYNITHRIVEIAFKEDGNVDYFKTKGDSPAVGVDDWQLEPSEVKAKFVRVSPFIAGLKRFISHWYGYVVLVVIPILFAGTLVIAGIVRDKRKAAKANESETDERDMLFEGEGNDGAFDDTGDDASSTDADVKNE